MSGSSLVGETKFVECAIQPVAAAVAGEHSSSAIAAVRSRGQADQKQSCLWITKTRIGFSPVIPILEASRFLACDFLSPLYQPGAESAANDLLLEEFELSVHQNI